MAIQHPPAPEPQPWRVRLAGLVALTLAFATIAGVVGITPARADGDPASDVLVAAPPAFLGDDSGATYAAKQTIVQQIRRAARHGHPLRVAVIASRTDLGSVGALWGHPEGYAEFLGRELSLDYHGQLLVVMPAGFGVVRDGLAQRTTLTGVAPRSGHLIRATEQAIARLTGVAAGAAVPAAGPGVPSPASGLGWWIATGLGLALIAGAWTASLRARPPRTARFAARAGSGRRRAG